MKPLEELPKAWFTLATEETEAEVELEPESESESE